MSNAAAMFLGGVALAIGGAATDEPTMTGFGALFIFLAFWID